jgi:hypothetical protein
VPVESCTLEQFKFFFDYELVVSYEVVHVVSNRWLLREYESIHAVCIARFTLCRTTY